MNPFIAMAIEFECLAVEQRSGPFADLDAAHRLELQADFLRRYANMLQLRGYAAHKDALGRTIE